MTWICVACRLITDWPAGATRIRTSWREDVPAQNLDEILKYRGTADLFSHLLDRARLFREFLGIQPKVLGFEMKSAPESFVASRSDDIGEGILPP